MNFKLLFFSCLLLSVTNIYPSIAAKTLFLPVTKVLHSPRNQYVTVVKQRTPLISVKLTVDLGLEYPWVICDHGYVSSTYKPAHCGSAQCSFAKHIFENCQDCYHGGTINTPGCNNNTCVIDSFNTVGQRSVSGELFQDVVTLKSADGRLLSSPNLLFVCSFTDPFAGLASGVKGIAALGRTKVALPSQLAVAFGLDRKFAICLSSSTTSSGALFFGKGPYNNTKLFDVSKALTYTSLLTNPAYGKDVGFYYIGVKSIKVNGKLVPVDSKYLSFGYPVPHTGGTSITTTQPYTVMQHWVYYAVVEVFVEEMEKINIPRVADVAPFEGCYNSTHIARTAVGPALPSIDFVMGDGAIWRIHGANSMVQVAEDVLCLAFIKDGEDFSTNCAIDIGGYQLEDNFLQFDIANNRLGFSSSLLSKQTSCSDFNLKYH